MARRDDRGRNEAPRASAGAVENLARCGAPSWRAEGLGGRTPRVVIRRTRHSRPASSKIASANSAHVHSPCGRDVVRAVRQLQQLLGRRGEVADVRGRAALVVDDRHLVLLCAQAQHRPHEVVARPPEEPRAADDPALAHLALALELRPPVHRERARLVRLDIRLASCARRTRSPSSSRRPGARARRRSSSPATFTRAAPSGSASAPSTSVQAAACSTR